MAKVLVIDDEQGICELIQMALKTKGHDVRYSTTGSGGIQLFQEFAPDILLLDLTLPDMDGTDLARQVKETEHGKKTPIILISGRLLTAAEIDKSLFAGLLEKPFSMSKLVAEVQKYLVNA